MSVKVTSYPTKGNVVKGEDTSQSKPRYVAGSGDSINQKRFPKGAEVLRRRAEPGRQKKP